MRFLWCVALTVVTAATSCSPAWQCSAATCASGCCDAAGKCQAGTLESACGSQGNQCNVCVSPQVCSASVCAVPVVDAGIDAGIDAGVEPQPIVAPAETWTWVDFADTVCGNGKTTGLGINITGRSTDLFIYFEGGGACWDTGTCFVAGTANNLTTGYTQTTWLAEGLFRSPGFLRTRADNPFKSMSYVVVPYCTGDSHSGNAVTTLDNGAGVMTPVHFKGGANVEAYLRRLAVTFPLVTRVFVVGSSAGAYGAQINLPRVVAAFPRAQVHVLADSGQMIQPSGTLLSQWRTAWGQGDVPNCAQCSQSYPAYLHWLTTTYPQTRFGLLAYTQDAVLRTFFDRQPADFETQTRALLTAEYDPAPNARYFLLSGDSHTMLAEQFTLSAPSGATLNHFVSQWVNPDGGWVNVTP